MATAWVIESQPPSTVNEGVALASRNIVWCVLQPCLSSLCENHNWTLSHYKIPTSQCAGKWYMWQVQVFPYIHVQGGHFKIRYERDCFLACGMTSIWSDLDLCTRIESACTDYSVKNTTICFIWIVLICALEYLVLVSKYPIIFQTAKCILITVWKRQQPASSWTLLIYHHGFMVPLFRLPMMI